MECAPEAMFTHVMAKVALIAVTPLSSIGPTVISPAIIVALAIALTVMPGVFRASGPGGRSIGRALCPGARRDAGRGKGQNQLVQSV